MQKEAVAMIEDAPVRFYNEAVRRKLIAEFEVEAELQQEFTDRLETAALIWWQERASPFMPDVDWSEISQFWKVVLKHTEKLAGAISDRPSFVDERMTIALQSKIDMHALSIMQAEQENRPRPMDLLLSDAEAIQPNDLLGLASMLEVLRQHAEMELQILSSNKAGRKPDRALSLWMTNMYNLWTARLGRSFTRQVYGRGTAVSPAARFVLEAFQPLDADVTHSQILTQMGHTISRYRNRR